MKDSLVNTALFGLYQFSIAVGILLLPVALLARRVGIPLRFDRLVERTEAAYDSH